MKMEDKNVQTGHARKKLAQKSQFTRAPLSAQATALISTA